MHGPAIPMAVISQYADLVDDPVCHATITSLLHGNTVQPIQLAAQYQNLVLLRSWCKMSVMV